MDCFATSGSYKRDYIDGGVVIEDCKELGMMIITAPTVIEVEEK